MGISFSRTRKKVQFYEWNLLEMTEGYAVSNAFDVNGETFVSSFDKKINTIFIYCCTARKWNFDESFNFHFNIRFSKSKIKKEQIKTVGTLSVNKPFVAIKINRKIVDLILIKITFPNNYPYVKMDNYVGLKNSGSTCYMASVIQVLFHIGAFRQLIYSFKNPKELTAALQNLFVELQTSSRDISLNNLICTLGSVNDFTYVQQDAHEFFVVLMEKLEKDLGGPFIECISKLFQIVFQKEIVHNDCKNKVKETYLALPIVVDGINSLDESIHELLKEQELVDNNGNKIIQNLKFVTLPLVLIFQLSRYKYSSKTNEVIEINSSFFCPNNLEIGENQYELFAIIAHCGTSTFGHYISFIRVEAGKQWYMFNDSSVSKVSEADVMHSFDGKSSSLSFGFGIPLAYMVFYIKKDSTNIINSSDSIPVYLAPFKTNNYFSNFIFDDEIKDLLINNNNHPYEWLNQNETFLSISKKLRPDYDISNYLVWVQLPGKSDFIGPISLNINASIFVIKGHSSNFFILPEKFKDGPIFISSKKSPLKYLEIITKEDLLKSNTNKYISKFREIKSENIIPGLIIQKKFEENIQLSINSFKLSFPRTATYSEVQAKLSLILSEKPEKILLMHNSTIFKPWKYPYISTVPQLTLSYQILGTKATAISISLYSSINLMIISDHFLRKRAQSIFIKKGFTCKDCVETIPYEFFDIILPVKMKYQCSIGTESSIKKFLSLNYHPKNNFIRIDLIRYEIPFDKWRLLEMLKEGCPMCIEVRCSTNHFLQQFESISRLIPINKNSITSDIIEKYLRLNHFNIQKSIKALLFANEKIKLQYELDINSNIYESLNIFIKKLTLPKQRICVCLISDDFSAEN